MKESKKVKITEQKKQEEVENNEIPQNEILQKEKNNGGTIEKGENSDGDIRPFKSSKGIRNMN